MHIFDRANMNLNNKIAIVTGGSRGIGEAICYSYAKEGATVIVVSYKNEQLGQVIANKIIAGGGNAEALSCDIRNKDAISRLVEYVINKYNRIDIVVHSAGVLVLKPMEEQTLEDWDYVMDTNLKGPFLLSQAVIPYMKKQRYGKIIFISSLAAFKGGTPRTSYGASKGGLVGLAKAMVAELAEYNINVNCILPGNVATNMNLERRQCNPDLVESLRKRTPNGKAFMSPSDVTGAALYLASELSDAVNGIDLVIDNGLYAV